MLRESLLAAIGLLDLARAQQIGTNTPEVNPSLPFSQCTSSGCTKVNTGVTLDANWRWLHTTTGYTNCYTGNTWDKSICTSSAVCGQQCAIDGADYANTYGIRTSGDALTLGFKTGNNLGSRTYLLNPAGNAYQMFRLKNREFTFDVDVSKLACGLDGALYFSEMPEKGAGAPGAKYGTGYCDAQCAQDLKFVNGVANNEGWVPSSTDQTSGAGKLGACCAEMDVWEANSISQAVTPHVCTGQGLTTCSSPSQCGSGTGNRYSGVCDKDGCDSNPFRLGNTSFYGPGKTVNTNAKITVTTQFITSGNSDTGTLTEIRRIYKQNGKVIPNAASNIAGIDKTNSVNSKFCSQQKSVFGDPDDFAKKGGLAKMGDAMGRGMVLVMSLWTDNASSMLWLDGTFPVGGSGPGVVRGTCDATSGLPANVVAQHPDASVTFSNIKFGAIGST